MFMARQGLQYDLAACPQPGNAVGEHRIVGPGCADRSGRLASLRQRSKFAQFERKPGGGPSPTEIPADLVVPPATCNRVWNGINIRSKCDSVVILIAALVGQIDRNLDLRIALPYW